MGYYSSLKRTIYVNDQIPRSWPALLRATFTLGPEEVFRAPVARGPVIVVGHGECRFFNDVVSGHIRVEEPAPIGEAKIPDMSFGKGGRLSIQGNVAILEVEALNWEHVNLSISNVIHRLGVCLSVQIGIFTEVVGIEASLAGEPLFVRYHKGTTSLLVTFLSNDARDAWLSSVLFDSDIHAPEFSRFMVAAFYFQHALRLLSPHEVNFVPYVAHAEVALNLAKCLEVLCGGTVDKIRSSVALRKYDSDQIESQIVPIVYMRNKLDVAHAGGHATQEDLRTIRAYIDRSVLNVGNLLKDVWQQINDGSLKLSPLDPSDGERGKFLKRLEEHLAKPPLHPEPKSVGAAIVTMP